LLLLPSFSISFFLASRSFISIFSLFFFIIRSLSESAFVYLSGYRSVSVLNRFVAVLVRSLWYFTSWRMKDLFGFIWIKFYLPFALIFCIGSRPIPPYDRTFELCRRSVEQRCGWFQKNSGWGRWCGVYFFIWIRRWDWRKGLVTVRGRRLRGDRGS
jgi:hypothetical protein